MQISVPIYQLKRGKTFFWTTLGLGAHTLTKSGNNPMKLQRNLTRDIAKVVENTAARALDIFEMRRGLEMERVHLELTLKGKGKKRKISGLYPLVLEQRWLTDTTRIFVVYHPLFQDRWFPLEDRADLHDQAVVFFQTAWAEVSDERLHEFESLRQDRLKIIAFSARTQSILDELPDRNKSIWADLETDIFEGRDKKKKKPKGYKILNQIGVNLSPKVVEGGLLVGAERQPYRKQLQLLLCGTTKRSVLVVGPPGVGKTTLLNRCIMDRLESDDYAAHRNLDKVHSVWKLSGRQLIAGMSYFGDWEKRCIDILLDVQLRKSFLWIDDLPSWGRIGQSREADRSLADFFRGPLARGEVVMVGECTPEGLQRLEDEAPLFVEQFTRIHVEPTTPTETLPMMLQAARELEMHNHVSFSPLAYRTLIELAGSLFPSLAFPGKVLDLLRQSARDAKTGGIQRTEIGSAQVIALLAQRTGLPEVLLEPEKPLDPEELEGIFKRRVMGQPDALRAAVDLIVRIKSGMTDPRRPYGVYLFTGPTGTGKTEMSRSIAAYLYGDPARLLRFDMSEFSHPDAPARLIGDRWRPRGLLTSAISERPFSVVLLDEIEKAHPSVLNLLLQLFDEGRLTDASGKRSDFTHAVIIMTSNLGAQRQAPVGFGEVRVEEVLLDVARAVRDFFPPELFNRIDQIVPFHPLNRTSAERIAFKELSLLLARRGLTERNISAYANASVVARMLDEAFDPRDGARSVKRYLEDNIGTLLTEHITSRKQASMESLRLYVLGDVYKIYSECLTEVDTDVVELTLEPLLTKPVAELEAMIPEALVRIEQLAESPEVQQLSERLHHHLELHNLGADGEHADPVYFLDLMRNELQSFAERLEQLVEARDTSDPELLEVKLFSREHMHEEFEGRTHKRIYDRKMMFPEVPRPVRHELLHYLADVFFIKRALQKVHDPKQHEVFIELLRVGEAHAGGSDWFGRQTDGLLEWLAHGYIDSRGSHGIASFAVRVQGAEEVVEGHQLDKLKKMLEKPIQHLVLKKVGLCVLDRFSGEQGCHVHRSMSSSPGLVRVRVWPAKNNETPGEMIEVHAQGVKAFQAALEEESHNMVLPPNPEHLLPVVRTIVFDPPRRKGQSSPLEVEDYRLGYSETLQTKNMWDILPRLWQLRMSAIGMHEEEA